MIRTLVLAGLLTTGCAPSITDTDFFREHPADIDSEETSTELGIVTDGNLRITLSAPDSLQIGSSIVWAEATIDGSPISDADITVLSRWVTKSRTIDSPLGAVRLVASDTPGRLEGIPIFVPPHGEEGYWQLKITHKVGGKSGESVLPIKIKSSIWVQYTDGYYISWVQPIRPVIGLDVIEFALHRLVDKEFLPMEDASIDLYPWMDMGADQGHSTPYEAPRHVSHGLYKGTVNFIMSGGWEMTVLVQRPDVPQDTINFKGFTVY